MNSKRNILIVDDERVVCDAIGRLLNDRGYRAEVAYGGAAAIEHIEKESFDAVLIDIRMPKVDGFDVLEALKTKRPDSKAIMMTSYADISSAVDSISKGAIDILSKPIDIDELVLTIERYFPD